MHSDHPNGSSWPAVLALLLVAVSVGRIVSTYHVFNQTWDEAVHVACGMEWLQFGTYNFEDLHPPLARVAVALGPYLSGIRMTAADPNGHALDAGNDIFAAGGRYMHNLALARLGVLPFFLMTAWIVWHWTRSLFGVWPAVAAVGLFTEIPPILGHSGVATTDMALTATLAVSLFAFANWLNRPGTRSAVLLGIALGFAILSKFTALMFLVACAPAVLLCWFFAGQTTPNWRDEIRSRRTGMLWAAVLCALVVFAGYRFSFHPVTDAASRPHRFLDRAFSHEPTLHDLSYKLVEKTPLPVPEFFIGMKDAESRGAGASNMYLLGQVRTRGWWYFFPVALAVKTPIAFLILMAFGAFASIRKWKDTGRDWRFLVPLASALALLLICLPTRFNIGLRHVLPIYPLLSILAGLGLVQLWQFARSPWIGRVLAVGLAGWMLASSAMAQPDNLAYFNELAGKHPERILVDSDLDWGQDLLRLSNDLRALHVEHVAIAYNGSADLTRMNLPSFETLPPCDPVTGWVAVSLYDVEMGKASPCGGFSWLNSYRPVELVGKSILLYDVPAPGAAHSAPPSGVEAR